MLRNDRIRMQHMLDSARESVGFVQGKSRDDLGTDRLLTLGILKCIEIIGEAAARIDKETQKKYQNILWSDIIGMRNRLVHIYFDIDLDTIWKTVTQDIPPLIEELEKVLEKEKEL